MTAQDQFLFWKYWVRIEIIILETYDRGRTVPAYHVWSIKQPFIIFVKLDL